MNDAPHDDRAALVLFSDDQDSITSLARAPERFAPIETIAFDYRQRHLTKLDQRLVVLDDISRRLPRWANRLGERGVEMWRTR